jgi:hypothetical protein
MQLSKPDQDRVREHLGYTAPKSIPSSLEMFLVQAMENIRSSYAYKGLGGITYWLKRCDKALIASDPTDSRCFSQRQLILGDTNRSTTTIAVIDIDRWYEYYLKETDRLAFKLNIANLQRPNQAQMLWTRLGSDYVQGIKGNPDTCISDRIYLSKNYR